LLRSRVYTQKYNEATQGRTDWSTTASLTTQRRHGPQTEERGRSKGNASQLSLADQAPRQLRVSSTMTPSSRGRGVLRKNLQKSLKTA
jgi:hypothetical protein